MRDVHLKCSASRAFYNEKNCRPTISTARLHWMCSRQTNSVGVKQISKRMKNKMRKMRESLYSFIFLKKNAKNEVIQMYLNHRAKIVMFEK